MKIMVPATSANIGVGFDSIGLAVNLFLTLEILSESDSWEIEHNIEGVPHDETNLIIQTALNIVPTMKPHILRMTSDIPAERGLGSSSSAIVAGIELACTIGGKEMSLKDKLELACEIEGHPDNVVPALLGGLVVSSYHEGVLEYVKANIPDVGLIAYVPNYKLPTTEMREILPKHIPFAEAVSASAISNTMVASLLMGDMEQAGRMMERDLFHEKYRSELVPELQQVRKIGHKHGSYGTYLSGAGSTIMCVCPLEKVDEIANALEGFSGDVLKLNLLHY